MIEEPRMTDLLTEEGSSMYYSSTVQCKIAEFLILVTEEGVVHK